MSIDTAIQRHHSELARAAAAAMQKHYQETIDIVSDLLTSSVYEEISGTDPECGKQFRAEARLMMATAMHYNDAHYEDILRVLNAALDSPVQIQKDVLFTLAVLQLSFDHVEEAKGVMNKALEIISELRSSGTPDPDGSLAAQEQEAQHFLNEVDAEVKRKGATDAHNAK